MKTYKYILLYIAIFIITLLSLTGCGRKEPIPEPIIRTETQKVYIPVYCEPKEEVKCEFKGDGSVVVAKLVKCISDLKVQLAYCSKNKMSKHVDKLIQDSEDTNSTK